MEGGQGEEELGDAQSGPEQTPKPGQRLRNRSQPLASFQAWQDSGSSQPPRQQATVTQVFEMPSVDLLLLAEP